jgi:hypothetical protein
MGNNNKPFFKIHQNEETKQYEAWISGTITADSGSIAGWQIGTNKLYYNLKSFSQDIGGKKGFYIGNEGIRFTNSTSGVESNKNITEWYVNADSGAMYLGVNNSFTNIWANKGNYAYSQLKTNLSINKDGLLYYITDKDGSMYFGS